MIWDTTLRIDGLSNHLSHIPVQEELIQQLLLPKQLMMVAGQFGIGKTNELLHLSHCFASGGSWHGLEIRPSVCLYMIWEGDPRKIGERIKIIETQYAQRICSSFIRFVSKKIPLNTAQGRENLSRIVSDLKPKPEIILMDPFKRTVSGDYTKPGGADLWIEGANEVAKALEVAIITSNHTNKIVYRSNSTPDELSADRVKGAGDLLDGVDAAILLAEEKVNRRVTVEGGYSKVVWSLLGFVIKVLKARDAIASFPLLKVTFSREKLRFVGEKWVIKDNYIEVAGE